MPGGVADMGDINTGGPAFPTNRLNVHGKVVPNEEGMTLRDYFAAKALLVGGPMNKSPAYDDETRARYAYELADAMLKARQ